MPFMDLKMSCDLTEPKELKLKEAFGTVISEISGKSEASLMIQFEDDCRMWFKGKNDLPAAFLHLLIYGNASENDKKAFSQKAIGILNQELDIPKENVYVQIDESTNWFFSR